jgi:hypothetical protein
MALSGIPKTNTTRKQNKNSTQKKATSTNHSIKADPIYGHKVIELTVATGTLYKTVKNQLQRYYNICALHFTDNQNKRLSHDTPINQSQNIFFVTLNQKPSSPMAPLAKVDVETKTDIPTNSSQNAIFKEIITEIQRLSTQYPNMKKLQNINDMLIKQKISSVKYLQNELKKESYTTKNERTRQLISKIIQEKNLLPTDDTHNNLINFEETIYELNLTVTH